MDFRFILFVVGESMFLIQEIYVYRFYTFQTLHFYVLDSVLKDLYVLYLFYLVTEYVSL